MKPIPKRYLGLPKKYRWLLLGALLSFIAPFLEWLYFLAIDIDLKDLEFKVFLFTEILTLITFSFFGYFLGKQADNLALAAQIDSLTCIPNRSYALGELKEHFSVASRYKTQLSIMLLDLDHFKNVNDTYGHATGDKTLIAVAQAMTRTVREADIVGRYGGEEFLIVCPNTSISSAIELANRICKNIKALPTEETGQKKHQTISIGLAQYSERVTAIKELLDNADKALYIAKSSGRDRVSVLPNSGKNLSGILNSSDSCAGNT